MKSLIGIVTLAIATHAAAPASAQTLFGWSGGWEITQKREFCTMRHAGAAEIVVTKTAALGRTAFSATSLNWSFDSRKDYSLILLDSGNALVTGWAYGDRMPVSPSGFSIDVNDDELISLFAAHTVTVHFYFGEQADLTFAMPPSATAARDLNLCVADIRAHEGGSSAPAVTPPHLIGTQEELMTVDDYPAAAWRAEVDGTVTVRLTVTAMGYPSACVVIESSGHEGLDTAACRIYQRRARFEPARDEKGRPTRGSFDFTKQWILPPPRPLQVSPARKY